MKRFVTILAAATVMSMSLLTSTPARATAPGRDGRVAFRRYLNRIHKRGAIFTIDPDGTGERQVTHPPKGILDTQPDVSPNGRWITFTRIWQRQGPRGAIVRIHPNGEGRDILTRVTCTPASGCVYDWSPSYSPGGGRIAFSRVFDPGGLDLYVMRADGTHLREVTDPGDRFNDWAPQWSPDGNRLVFFREDTERPDESNSAIFTVRLDGTHVQRLTDWGLNADNDPDWSPGGRWIVFAARRGHETHALWMVHPNGTELHKIAGSAGRVDWLSSSFSPSGRWIVSSRNDQPELGDAGNADVFILRLDGSVVRNVTRSGATWESAPDWGPLRT